MAKAHIKKLTLIGLQSEKQAVMKLLHKMGNVQVQQIVDEEGDKGSDAFVMTESYKKYQAAYQNTIFALDFLDGYERYKKGLLTVLPPATEEELERLLDDETLNRYIEETKDLDKQLAKLKTEENKIIGAIENLLPWETLDIPMKDLEGSKNVEILAGAVFSTQMEEISEAFLPIAPSPYLEVVSTSKDMTYFVVYCHKETITEVQEAMRNAGFAKFETQGGLLSPKEEKENYEECLKTLEAERNGIAERAKEILVKRPELQRLADYLTIVMDREGESQLSLSTKNAFILKGYIDEVRIDKLRSALQKKFEFTTFTTEDPLPDEEVPILIKNSKFVRPFEVVTNLYSSPGKADIDPNPWFTPFFILFFGMMFSDVGYGAILTAGAVFYLVKAKPKGVVGDIVTVMISCGISTIFWGFMYGGCFGDLFGLKPIWINPADDPMTILIFSLGLGIIHIFVGMIAMAYKNFKEKNYLAILFDQCFWMFLIIGIGLMLLPETAMIGQYMAIVCAVGLLLTQGRAKKGIFGKLFGGLGSLYNITGYFSDILSYARVLALGLATGIIATVINTLARLMGDGLIGMVFMIVILIAGHTFNLLINLLGTFVHTARLQYVEFFGKFYEGGGSLFSPFKINTKYITYQESEEL